MKTLSNCELCFISGGASSKPVTFRDLLKATEAKFTACKTLSEITPDGHPKTLSPEEIGKCAKVAADWLGSEVAEWPQNLS